MEQQLGIPNASCWQGCKINSTNTYLRGWVAINHFNQVYQESQISFQIHAFFPWQFAWFLYHLPQLSASETSGSNTVTKGYSKLMGLGQCAVYICRKDGRSIRNSLYGQKGNESRATITKWPGRKMKPASTWKRRLLVIQLPGSLLLEDLGKGSLKK